MRSLPTDTVKPRPSHARGTPARVAAARRLALCAMAAITCVLGWPGTPGASGRAARAPSAAAPAGSRAARADAVTAWLPYWEMPAALNSTIANAGAIGTASPYWYYVAGDGRIHGEAGAGSATVIAELRAHGVQVVPMVTEEAGLRAFAGLLANATRRAALTRRLVAVASQTGVAGLDLDFESFAYDPGHLTAPANAVATLYPRLVAQVCRALHAIGRSCQVAVMARTGPASSYAHRDIATWVYDYRALAVAADRVQIMAYDYHSPGGPAGPIAPLPWVRQVIAYARTQGDPSHYELGVPAYGYEWYGRTSATAVYARQGAVLAAQVHARPRWNATAGEQTFSYRVNGHRRIVWYVDARADLYRARLAAEAGFSGVAVWAAGYEQPELWRQLGAAHR